jgi:hypothetical protein
MSCALTDGYMPAPQDGSGVSGANRWSTKLVEWSDGRRGVNRAGMRGTSTQLAGV